MDFLTRDRVERLDPAIPPPLRFALIQLAAEQHLLVFTCHHILLDGWSMPILVDELLSLYSERAPSSLPPVTPYREYLAWLSRQDREAAVAAWRDALADLDSPTLLAPQTASQPSAFIESIPLIVSERTTDALTRWLRTRHTTLNTFIQAVWAILLGRLTARDVVVFGVTVSGRPPDIHGIERMVGLFINTLPLRIKLRPDTCFADLLDILQENQSNLIKHQHLGLAQIQGIAGLGDLFDTILVFENYPKDNTTSKKAAAGLRLKGVSGRDATHYALSITVEPGPRLALALNYQPDAFDRDAMQSIGTRFRTLIETLISRPDQQIGQLDILFPDERETILRRWNATARTLSSPTVLDLFEAHVARAPNAVALMLDEQRITYGELDAHANKLAHHLCGLGVAPETIVGLCVERSLDLVVAHLGILKAGGAYLPLDPDYPRDRIGYMLELAGVAVVVTMASLCERLPQHRAHVVRLDADHAVIAREPTLRPHSRLVPLNNAYVIYTSGSTGAPKGVAVTHDGLVNHMLWLTDTYPTGADDIVLSRSAISFDASLFEIWLALVSGAALSIAQPSIVRDPVELCAHIERHRVTTAAFLPTLLQSVIVAMRPSRVPRLRRLFVGGETVSPALVRETAAVTDAEIANFYGPTETTIDATYWSIRDTNSRTSAVPIGRPIWNTQAYVLDAGLAPLSSGVTGELYLAGTCLARGYLGRPALTAECFVANPFGPPGSRMYRTGDLARWRADGVLDFLGRVDHQVKLRGHRIELGEIEATLTRLADVTQATVIMREDHPGNRRLVAYVVPPSGRTSDPTALRSGLARTLPDYMLPSAIVPIDRLPLTLAGKLDWRALPAPDFTPPARREPRTPEENALCGLFAEVLGLDRVGTDDNFFEHGGDSLLSMQLVSRIRDAFGLDISVRIVFEAPTVAAMAVRLGGASEVSSALDVILPLRPRGSLTPLFCIHPGGGVSWCYSGLLRHLPERRAVYGLQARGVLHPDLAPRSIENMAKDYCAQIQRLQPEGPYNLLGWSFGGLVAHAIATHLQSQREQISLLAIVDSFPVGHVARSADASGAKTMTGEFGSTDPSRNHTENPFELPAVLDYLRREENILATLDEKFLTAIIEVAKNSICLGGQFVPGRFLWRRLVFCQHARCRPAPAEHLGALCRRRHPCPSRFDCEHDHMMRRQSLEKIGPVLASELTKRLSAPKLTYERKVVT